MAVGVVALGEQVEHRLAGGHAEDEVHAEVAVVRGEVVGAALERHGRAHLGRFLARAGDDERRAALAVEREHAFVQAPREEHVVVHLFEFVFGEEVVFDGLTRARAAGLCCRHIASSGTNT